MTSSAGAASWTSRWGTTRSCRFRIMAAQDRSRDGNWRWGRAAVRGCPSSQRFSLPARRVGRGPARGQGRCQDRWPSVGSRGQADGPEKGAQGAPTIIFDMRPCEVGQVEVLGDEAVDLLGSEGESRVAPNGDPEVRLRTYCSRTWPQPPAVQAGIARTTLAEGRGRGKVGRRTSGRVGSRGGLRRGGQRDRSPCGR